MMVKLKGPYQPIKGDYWYNLFSDSFRTRIWDGEKWLIEPLITDEQAMKAIDTLANWKAQLTLRSYKGFGNER